VTQRKERDGAAGADAGVLVFVILFPEIIVALRSRLMPQVVK